MAEGVLLNYLLSQLREEIERAESLANSYSVAPPTEKNRYLCAIHRSYVRRLSKLLLTFLRVFPAPQPQVREKQLEEALETCKAALQSPGTGEQIRLKALALVDTALEGKETS